MERLSSHTEQDLSTNILNLSSWRERAFNGQRPIGEEIEHWQGEIAEAHEHLLSYPPDQFDKAPEEVKRAFAEEIIDTVIAGRDIVAQMGFDYDQMLRDKEEVREKKYPPEEIVVFLQNGVSTREAMRELKQRWSTP